MYKIFFSYFLRDHSFSNKTTFSFLFLSPLTKKIIGGTSKGRLMSPYYMCPKGLRNKAYQSNAMHPLPKRHLLKFLKNYGKKFLMYI
jgi:hypothetical protein